MLFRRFAFVVLATAVGQVAFAAEEKGAGGREADLDVIKRFIAGHEKELPGGVIMVARAGQVVVHEPFGMMNIETKEKTRRDTIYRLASMTKPIVTVAVMQLYEGGHFSLDDPISKYLPEFEDIKVLAQAGPAPVTAKAPITIRHLLTNMSGIPEISHPILGERQRELGIDVFWNDRTLGETVEALATLPLACHPGEKWEYGLSTDVLGHLVEEVSGKSLDEYLREKVLQPLKMEDTYFYLPSEKTGRISAVTELTVQGKLRQIPDGWQTNIVTVPDGSEFTFDYRVDGPYAGSGRYFSAGGLCATASDYMRFCQMLVNHGELDGVPILRPETVRMMTSNQIGRHTVREDFGWRKFGLGFGIEDEEPGDPLHKAYGWGGAFGTYFWVAPVSDGIFVLMGQISPPSKVNCLHLRPAVKELARSVLAEGK
jgi:CubicO group peptidase (beta-lactamase class C family)